MTDDFPCEGDFGGCFLLATGACPTCCKSLCDECFAEHLDGDGLCPERFGECEDEDCENEEHDE